MTTSIAATPRRDRALRRLCAVSEARPGRLADVVWPERLSDAGWGLPAALCSLEGTPRWAAMTPEARRRSSLAELYTFMSVNVYGERLLLAGVEARLGRPDLAFAHGYLEHFAREEREHLACFVELCERFGPGLRPDRLGLLGPAASSLPPALDDLVFFARVTAFEEVVDAINDAAARAAEVDPFLRDIHRAHHVEEARHLVFGRLILGELAARAAEALGDPEMLATVQRAVSSFLRASLAALVDPDAYREVGIPDPFAARREALQHPAGRRRLAHLEARAHAVLAPFLTPLPGGALS